MRYLQTYEQHNEGIKSTLAGIGLAGSLLTGTPALSQNQDLIQTSQVLPTDGMSVAKNNIQEISDIRKSMPVKDEELNSILDEIQTKLESNDSEEFKQIFGKLSNHLENKYGYKIEAKTMDEISEAGAGEMAKGMSLFEIMGWLGSICLAICGVPQAVQSYKDKHSEGISNGFLILWALGEVFALAYVYDKLDLPLLLNYATNIFILAVIIYYKMYPKKSEDNNDKEIRRFH